MPLVLDARMDPAVDPLSHAVAVRLDVRGRRDHFGLVIWWIVRRAPAEKRNRVSEKTGDRTLEFSAAEMRAMAEEVVARSIEHIASAERQPSRGDVDADGALPGAARTGARSRAPALGPLLDHLFRDCIPRSFTTIGPGYLAYIPGGGLYPAALADFIADTTNRFTGIWQAAPVLVQLEANALDWLRDWMGFPETTRGLFTTGGSMATFNAILCARERQLGADIRRGVLYTSDQAHHSVLKSAKMAGVMPDRVRAIPADDRYRLRVDAPAGRDRATIGARA